LTVPEVRCWLKGPVELTCRQSKESFMFRVSVCVGGDLKLRILAMFAAMLMVTGTAMAGGRKETVLYTFQGGTDGTNPTGPLVADSAGNLYGTTQVGGSAGHGMVFELTQEGDVWKKKALYSFQGDGDGSCPNGGMIFDQAGNLYGGTGQDDTGLCAPADEPVVFQLALNGGVWIETVLYRFPSGTSNPVGELVFDEKGNLYGTTPDGGTHRKGTVFRLSPNSNGSWTKRDLYNFYGAKGGELPFSGVILGRHDVLYGTTAAVVGGGTVFTLTPPAGSRHTWHHRVIYSFSGTRDGAGPGALILRSDKLYGVTGGSGPKGFGTVFELTPPAQKDGQWNEITLYAFSGMSDGAGPDGLVMDKAGNIYGTTFWGGLNQCNGPTSSCGVVFEISPQGTKWTEKGLYDFTGGLDGSNPTGGVIFGKDGALYGVTSGGDGESNPGTVFGVVP
jgi:uncharacterized repeat protein (TIGR03803 family)